MVSQLGCLPVTCQGLNLGNLAVDNIQRQQPEMNDEELMLCLCLSSCLTLPSAVYSSKHMTDQTYDSREQ